jgi:hypothetical protein
MYKRFLVYIILIIVITTGVLIVRFNQDFIQVIEPVKLDISHNALQQILLVPLDSRPPCTQFVEQLAAIAHISIQLPPQRLLDNYNTPANRQEIRSWLLSKSKISDTMIISVDMLIHGGLLASRLSTGEPDDINQTVELLKQIRKNNPTIKIYAFSIIPRLLIADSDENKSYQKDMAKYSIEKDLLSTFENPLDYNKLQQLEKKIPPNIIQRYSQLYEQNIQLNLILTDIVKQGVLDGLVIGQDDGYPFGLPNMVKTRLENYILHSGISDKVFITRGTDEVALTLLGHIITKNTRYTPKIHVRYSHKDAAATVMPFMPHSVETTVNEKIRIVNGVRTDWPEMADYIMYVHIGNRRLSSAAYDSMVRELQSLVNDGYKVALVDLSEDYDAAQTLLPRLSNHGIDIAKLASYAGWNTTSNSIGSAVTHIAILGATPIAHMPPLHAISSAHASLEFLFARMIDDWYFQKDVQPIVNNQLKKQGIDPYHLGTAYDRTNILVQKLLTQRSNLLYAKNLHMKPITVNTLEGPVTVVISDFSVQSSLPWTRTFEVKAKPNFYFLHINANK